MWIKCLLSRDNGLKPISKRFVRLFKGLSLSIIFNVNIKSTYKVRHFGQRPSLDIQIHVALVVRAFLFPGKQVQNSILKYRGTYTWLLRLCVLVFIEEPGYTIRQIVAWCYKSITDILQVRVAVFFLFQQFLPKFLYILSTSSKNEVIKYSLLLPLVIEWDPVVSEHPFAIKLVWTSQIHEFRSWR